MHAMYIRATARIVGIGTGCFMGMLDVADGTHVEFAEVKSLADFWNQLDLFARRNGLELHFVGEVIDMAARHPGETGDYIRHDHSLAPLPAAKGLSDREMRDEYNTRVREHNAKSWQRFFTAHQGGAHV